MKKGRKKVDIFAEFQQSYKKIQYCNILENKAKLEAPKGFASATLKDNDLTRPSMKDLDEILSLKRIPNGQRQYRRVLAAEKVSNQVENSIKEANLMNQHSGHRNSTPYTIIVG